jgi:hypothetical protein
VNVLVSPVHKSVDHNAAKSVNKSILKKSRHIGFDVFIVHSSMAVAVAVGGGGEGGHDRVQPRNHARSVDRYARTSLLSHKHTHTDRVGRGRLE